MGYDNERVYGECEDRNSRPIIPLRETPAVKAGKAGPPVCEHGEWRFAGADARRGGTKWRCPTDECSPASRWIKADRLHPLVPRESKWWKSLYRGRAAVEREFGRLKNEWGAAAAPRAGDRPGSAPCGLDDPRQARVCVGEGAGDSAACIDILGGVPTLEGRARSFYNDLGHFPPDASTGRSVVGVYNTLLVLAQQERQRKRGSTN